MVKIKQKKQLNLPQLIEWLLKSGYRNYTANSNMGNTVTLSRYGEIRFSLGTFFPEETFTVEIDGEITEDTVIPTLVTKNINGDYDEWTDRSVKDFVLAHMEAIYIINDDLTMTLIWRDGKMVE